MYQKITLSFVVQGGRIKLASIDDFDSSATTKVGDMYFTTDSIRFLQAKVFQPVANILVEGKKVKYRKKRFAGPKYKIIEF